jgi:hypothetical protein
MGFGHLMVNDVSHRSAAIAQGFLVNQTLKLGPRDLYYLNQALPPDTLRWVERQYAGTVFSTRHAQRLEQWIYWANQIQDPIRRALYHILIWHCVNAFLCFPTSRGTSNGPYAQALDGLTSWDSLNPKRFLDGTVDRLLKPSLSILKTKLQAVNQGVFRGTPVTSYQQDVLTLLPALTADIVYLDPPYAGTQTYEESFALVDSLLFPEQPTVASQIDFSESVEALHPLLESVQHIPTWILSYGNKQVDLDGLVHLVKQHAQGRAVYGYAQTYSHMRHLLKRQDNQELLIIATRGV